MLGTGCAHVGECAHLGSWPRVHGQEQHLQGRGEPVSLLYAASEKPWVSCAGFTQWPRMPRPL